MAKIEEANQVFLTKFAKNTENFQRNKKEFELNAGW